MVQSINLITFHQFSHVLVFLCIYTYVCVCSLQFYHMYVATTIAKYRTVLSPPRNSLMLPFSLFRSPNPKQPVICSLYIILLFQECYINAVTQ